MRGLVEHHCEYQVLLLHAFTSIPPVPGSDVSGSTVPDLMRGLPVRENYGVVVGVVQDGGMAAAVHAMSRQIDAANSSLMSSFIPDPGAIFCLGII